MGIRAVSLIIVNRMKLVTLNVLIRPPGIHNDRDDLKDERIPAILDLLRKMDVCAVQELFALFSPRRTRLLNNTGCYVVQMPTRFMKVDSGLAIITRKNPIDSGYTEFQAVSLGIDGVAMRGAVWAHIPGLHVFNTHLQSSHDEVLPYSQVRDEQLLELKVWIRKCTAADNDDIVLMGDFNVVADTDEYDNMMDMLHPFEDTVYKLQRKHKPTYGFDNELTTPSDRGKLQRLDYIFWWPRAGRWKPCAASVIEKELSDHRAVKISLS